MGVRGVMCGKGGGQAQQAKAAPHTPMRKDGESKGWGGEGMEGQAGTRMYRCMWRWLVGVELIMLTDRCESGDGRNGGYSEPTNWLLGSFVLA